MFNNNIGRVAYKFKGIKTTNIFVYTFFVGHVVQTL